MMKPVTLISGLLLAAAPYISMAKPAGMSTGPRPLSFIENKGQIAGKDQKPRTDIDFKLQAPGMSVYVGNGTLSYVFKKREEAKQGETAQRGKAYQVGVVLDGANANAEVIKQEEQAYYESYFLSQCRDGATAHSYNKVTYKNIYPNIDWVLYTRNNELKYDFVVRPGGRAADIKLRYEGATALAMKDGAVTASTPLGSITEKKPYSYDAVTRKELPSSFVLKGKTLGFNVAPSEHTVVIDPVIAWGTYYGEWDMDDYPQKVVTDASGNVYMAGWTHSDDEIAYNGQFMNLQGLIDAFIVKFDNDGNRLWATYYGGGADDYCYDIKIHPTGSIYICGKTNSPGIATPNTHQFNINGGFDAFLAKFTPGGAWMLGTYFGGPANEDCYALDFGIFGDIYIAGSTLSNTDIASSTGAQQQSNGGGKDAFLAKFNQQGIRGWSTYHGGVAFDEAFDVAVNANGHIYITGSTTSEKMPITPNGYDTTYSGEGDAFLARYDDGLMQYCTYYGHRKVDAGTALVVDDEENVYMIGYTASWDSISTPGSFKPNRTIIPGDTATEGFIAKIDHFGALVEGTYYGDYKHLQIRNAHYDKRTKKIYTVGRTSNIQGVVTPLSHQTTVNGGFDGFVAEWNKNLDRTWGTYYGGANNEDITGITTDTMGKIFFCGATNSTTNITTPGTHRDTWWGGVLSTDGFLVKFHDTVAFMNPGFNDTLICPPDSFDISYTVQVIFGATNNFTAQLSDATGSFANPTTIGSFYSNNSGTIKCGIPANTPPGNGYRVRVVSSSPVFATTDNGTDIRIFERPKPAITGTTTLCADDSLGFTATSTVAGVVYQWVGPNGFVFTGASPSVKNAPVSYRGRYVVTATANNCAGKDSIEVVMYDRPYTTEISSTGPVCEGSQLDLDVEGNTPNVNYLWMGPNGYRATVKSPIIEKTDQSHVGRFQVVMTSGEGCVSDTAGITVDIIKMEAYIKGIDLRTPGDTILLEATVNRDPDSVIWSWTGPAGFVSNQQNPMIEDITIAQRGDYFLTVNRKGCIAKASVHVRISDEIKFTLFPNPNSGSFTIKGNTEADQVINFEVTDAVGRAMYRDSTKTFRKHFTKAITMPVEPAAGVYILRLDVEGKKSDIKFVIMK